MARQKKTPEEFVAQMGQVAPEVEVLGSYVDARTKVSVRCRSCGGEWEATPNHLLRGAGCPRCAGTRAVAPEDFVARVASLAPTVEIVSSYVNARTRVRVRCGVCGNEWDPFPKSLLQGYGCPVCGRRRSRDSRRSREADNGAGKTSGDDSGCGAIDGVTGNM